MKRPSAIGYLSLNIMLVSAFVGIIYGILIEIIGMAAAGVFSWELITAGMLLGLFPSGILGLLVGLFLGIVLAVAQQFYKMPFRPTDMQRLKGIGLMACLLTFGALGILFYNIRIVLLGTNATATDAIVFIIGVCLILFVSLWEINEFFKKLAAFISGYDKAKHEATT